MSEVCGRCFEKYCWDGTESESQGDGAGEMVYDPQVKVGVGADALGGAKRMREDL